MKEIYAMRRLALIMFVFITGVAVGGNFPTWIKIGFPAACVLWLSFYDDFMIRRVQENEVKKQ